MLKTFTFARSGCDSSSRSSNTSTYSLVTYATCSSLICLRLSPKDLRIFSHWSRASRRTTLLRSTFRLRFDRIHK
ncbi:Uncharacterised protein [Mycobacteroides abscessus subsp. abscessus]|nr:Uncharacterised protein [Mycobacteroides abscessus subsp. abscessus]